ncbi:hypothetical protein [Haloprofundus salinisoli]|uniref:hypothetical protein n=1 Tax=Haloprofundus salinisoli TaxID=2876193 RepID=UPI001CCD809C|nr:hypothetical protein [Haloprofundus salinisoli]
MTLVVPISERFREASEEWADTRLMDPEDALEVKAEQALLEVEHLVSGAHEVEFAVEDGELRYEPSDELAALLSSHAERAGVDEATVLGLHVDLFARVFLDDAAKRPSNAPPK